MTNIQSQKARHLNIFVRFKNMKYGYNKIRMVSKDVHCHHNIIFFDIFKIINIFLNRIVYFFFYIVDI